MSKVVDEYIRGITTDNPIFGLVLGLCPLLAVTTSVENGIGMAAGAAFVLICSNVIISALRKQIPASVRGVFIPLIVVNCIIIGRAEAYANKNNVFYSLIDALGSATGFLLVLVLMGAIREILGTGAIAPFGYTLISIDINPATFMIMPPGAFLTIAILMAIVNYRKAKKLVRGG
jgi:electron transport complex protein RnfE